MGCFRIPLDLEAAPVIRTIFHISKLDLASLRANDRIGRKFSRLLANRSSKARYGLFILIQFQSLYPLLEIDTEQTNRYRNDSKKIVKFLVELLYFTQNFV